MQFETFPITNWCGVPQEFLRNSDGTVNLSRITDMTEAGLNLLSLEYDPASNCEVLAICEKLGVKAIVCDSRISSLWKTRPDGWEEEVAAAAREYRDYPALCMYHVTDEPQNADFPALARVVEILRENDPKHPAYINLFPNYASPAQLGAPTYRDHVADFIRIVKPEFVSYDHYHFCKENQIEKHEFADERERMIYENAFLTYNRAGFFENLEDIRELSLASGLPYMLIILVVEHGSYRNLTRAEIRWEAYQALAYGVSALSYFTYWTPYGESDEYWHWQNGMVSATGEKLDHYYDVQAINAAYSVVANLLLGHKSTAVFHVGTCTEKGTKPFSGFGGIDEIKGGDATVGFYEGGYVLLANKNYTDAVDFTITSGKLERFDPQTKTWNSFVGDTLTLDAGDAALFRTVD